ncbi:MAG: hypothetical protein AB1941_10095 [Gemmatimonadota bacterium]
MATPELILPLDPRTIARLRTEVAQATGVRVETVAEVIGAATEVLRRWRAAAPPARPGWGEQAGDGEPATDFGRWD